MTVIGKQWVLQRQHRTALSWSLVLLLTSSVGIGCLWANSSGGSKAVEGLAEQDIASATTASSQASNVLSPAGGLVLPDFATLAQKLLPGVVSVSVEKSSKEERGSADFEQYLPDFFRFFGRDMPKERDMRREMAPREERMPGMGSGSGFVIESDGLIVTNSHVVENASKIEIQFALPDGTERTVSAKLVGSAPHFDVALLKVEETIQVPVLSLGDSDRIRVGDWVMAIGNPLGVLRQSVSVGIISAKERRGVNPSGRQGYYNYLQTDASINFGNSGGPLVNLAGEVIGINSAIAPNGQGIGFAIPINMVKSMLPQLKVAGKFVRSYMGVGLQPLTPELAESYRLPNHYGALVGSVNKGEPGDKAGIKEGDIVLEFNGQKIKNREDLMLYASMIGVGKQIPLQVWRDGKQLTLQVTMAAFPDDIGKESLKETKQEQERSKSEAEEDTRWGLVIGELTADRAEKFGVTGEQGVLVERVLPNSPAARSGAFRGGEIIVDVQGKPVPNLAAWKRQIGDFKQSKIVRLRVQRGESKFYIALQQ